MLQCSDIPVKIYKRFDETGLKNDAEGPLYFDNINCWFWYDLAQAYQITFVWTWEDCCDLLFCVGYNIKHMQERVFLG